MQSVAPTARKTLQRVLVAIDADDSADGALKLALELGRSGDTEIVLCTSVDRAAVTAAAVTPDGAVCDVRAMLAACEAAAQQVLDAAAARLTAAGLHATTLLLDGRPASAIVGGASDAGADAIVMGTHGKHGLERMFLGSTAEGVLRMTALPTFVVRQAGGGTGTASPRVTECTFDRILVAVDDSDPSDAAAVFAIDFAAAHNSRLFCCTVIDTGALLDKAATYGYDSQSWLASLNEGGAELIAAKTAGAAAAGVTVEPIVVEGDAAEAVLAAATANHAGLIVVGTHGRRGLRRLFIGSVAESIIRRSGVPVAVVRESSHGARS